MKFVHPIRDLEQIENMKRILKKQNYRNYLLFCLGINTGLMIGDILNLKVSDVKDKQYITITEKKTGRTKKYFLNNYIQQILADYIVGMDDNDYLFTGKGRKDKPISRVAAYNILNHAAAEAGIEGNIGCNTMRKTFGYHYYMKHKDVALLQKLFNQSSPSVTLKYIGVEEDINESLGDFSL